MFELILDDIQYRTYYFAAIIIYLSFACSLEQITKGIDSLEKWLRS